MGIQWPDGYSATVEVYLEIAEERYCVERVSDGTIEIRDDCQCDPGTGAVLIIVVDGIERRLPIVLGRGIGATREPVPFF